MFRKNCTVPKANGHLEVAVVSTPKSLLLDVDIKRAIRRSNILHLIWLLVVDVMIQLDADLSHSSISLSTKLAGPVTKYKHRDKHTSTISLNRIQRRISGKTVVSRPTLSQHTEVLRITLTCNQVRQPSVAACQLAPSYLYFRHRHRNRICDLTCNWKADEVSQILTHKSKKI